MNSKYEKINENDYNYSHVGNASAKKYLYVLDRKNHLNNLLKGKKREKIIPNDYLCQEEESDIYNDIYEKEEYEDNIFDNDYQNKYKHFLEEQKQKYFNLKKSCSVLPIFFGPKNKKRCLDKSNNLREKKLMEKFNEDKFKYHLIHHYHDYYLDKSLKQMSLNKANHSSICYNPKLEYIFKKINYSPEFKKMRGRYDQQNIKEIIKRKLENNINQIKEKEYNKKMKKLEKIRASIKISSHKELLNRNEDENENNKVDDKLKRHNSVNEIFFENKFINNDDIINDSRNFKRKLFKRTNTTNNISFSIGFKKNLYNNRRRGR